MKTKQHSWRKKEKKKRAQWRGAHTPSTCSSYILLPSLCHTRTLSHAHPPTHSISRTHAHTRSLSPIQRLSISHSLFCCTAAAAAAPVVVFSFSGKKERPFCYKINRSTLTRIFIGRSQTEVRQFVFPNWFFCQFAQILCNEIFTSLNCVAGLLSSSLLLFPARKILILERI